MQILSPGLSYASGQPQAETAHRANRPEFVQDRATIVAERAIKSLYALDVRVMSREGLEISKLRTGLIAHVVHTSEGTRRSATGRIVRIAQDGIALWTAERPADRNKITYAGIDTLVVASDKRALDRWKRRAEGRFLVMSQRNLDLTKLNTGWYAFLVYKIKVGTRAVLTEIRDTEEGHVVIGPPYAAAGNYSANREIAGGDIEIIVAAENLEDIRVWRNATRVIPHLIGNPRIRFNASGFARREPDAKSVVGRLIEVVQDSFVVGVGRSGSNVFKLPLSSFTDFELNLGRRRNAGKGFLIGAGLWFFGGAILGAAKYDSQNFTPDTTGTVPILMTVTLIVGTTIGFFIKTDKWVEWDKLSPPRLDLAVATAQNRGLGAALSFDF